MNFLLLLRQDDSVFDEGAVFNAAEKLPGLEKADRKHRIDSLLEAHVRVQGDATIVRLSEDRKSVMFSGNGAAAFSAAFNLGRTLLTPLRVVDSDYTIDVPLELVSSPEDLQERYNNAQ